MSLFSRTCKLKENIRRVGTCSKCRGKVVVNYVPSRCSLGLRLPARDIPETIRCDACGATPKNRHGPVIEMQ